jgi:uncharacterized membrane protein YczE
VAQLESRLGLGPWDVLHQGLARHSPLSFGTANITVGVVVLAAAVLLGARIGVGTVANTLLVGTFVDLLLRLGSIRGLTHHALAPRIGLLALGLGLIGVGSGFYIGAAMGAGPRDSLMLILWRRTGIRVGAVRAGIEVSALAVGIALGGTFGVGTIAFALLVGPCIELSFAALERSPLATAAAASPASPTPSRRSSPRSRLRPWRS